MFFARMQRMPNANLKKRCADLINENKADMNLFFLDDMEEFELLELNEKLSKLSQENKLAKLTKKELHDEVNQKGDSFFYHDQFNCSMIFHGANSPLEKKQKIGQGKFSEVFKFQSSSTQEAIKYALTRKTSFAQEQKMAQQSWIPATYFFHSNKERIAIPFVQGKQLIHYLRSSKLGMSQWLKLALNIALKIKELHSNGVVHNDITPFNILVQSDLEVTIIDYGESHDDISLSYVDTYALSNMLLRKFQMLADEENSEVRNNVIRMFDQVLDTPEQISISNLLEKLQEYINNKEDITLSKGLL